MSIVIASGASNGLSSTSNLSSPVNFTKLIWVQFAGTPTAATKICGCEDSTGVDWASLGAGYTSGDLQILAEPSLGGSGWANFSSQPTWGHWICLAVTGTTAGSGSLIGYWQDNAGGGFATVSMTGLSFTNSVDQIGIQTIGETYSAAYYMEWATVLTPTQLASQFLSPVPIVATGSVNRYLPLNSAVSPGTDASGNGHNMSVTGTLTTGTSGPAFYQYFGEDAEQWCAEEDDAHELWVVEVALSAPVGPNQRPPTPQNDAEEVWWWDDYEDPWPDTVQWSQPVQPNAPPAPVEDWQGVDHDAWGDDWEKIVTDSAPVGPNQPPAPPEDAWPHFDEDHTDDLVGVEDSAPVAGVVLAPSPCPDDGWDYSDDWPADDEIYDDGANANGGAATPADPLEQFEDDHTDDPVGVDDSAPVGANAPAAPPEDGFDWSDDYPPDDEIYDDGANANDGGAPPEDAWPWFDEDPTDELPDDDGSNVQNPNLAPASACPEDGFDWSDDSFADDESYDDGYNVQLTNALPPYTGPGWWIPSRGFGPGDSYDLITRRGYAGTAPPAPPVTLDPLPIPRSNWQSLSPEEIRKLKRIEKKLARLRGELDEAVRGRPKRGGRAMRTAQAEALELVREAQSIVEQLVDEEEDEMLILALDLADRAEKFVELLALLSALH
jgi:hypothetical protein